MIEIEVTNHQSHVPLETARLEAAVQAVLEDAAIAAAAVSVAVVDDATIRELNGRYLKHDGPTDVLSFVLQRSGDCLEGEVVVSAERALAVAPQFGWAPAEELLLYVIHGALHLVGYDDGTRRGRAAMRRRERACLARFGVEARFRRKPDPRPGKKGDSPLLPERPGGCFAQKGTVPFFPGRAAAASLRHEDEEVP